MSVAYRPEIDGLRAIAVIPVVLFHLGVPGFSGGFVGVDVFFVISGFLITSIIVREVEVGTFSVRVFYVRRAKRILPALFVMLAAVTVMAAVILFPRDLVQYARSLVATVGFVSNVFFWRTSGYFERRAEENPLLHTWSLGVEEQFYIFFPLMIVLIWKWCPRSLLAAVVVSWLGSLLLSAAMVAWRPDPVFYNLPFRWWELTTGSLLAIARPPAPAVPGRADACSLIGLVLIAIPIVLYSNQTTFPGLAALPPCIGTALVIYSTAHPDGGVRRLLSLPLIVGIGTLSYSIYLWHWPLIVLVKYRLFREFTAFEIFAIAAATLALAYLTRRFIEKPCLAWRPVGSWPVFARSALAAAAIAVLAFFLASGGGLPNRFSPSVLVALAADTDANPDHLRCMQLDRASRGDLCRIGAAHAEKDDFLLWGDSHAEALLTGIDRLAADDNRSGRLAFYSGCAPFVGAVPEQSSSPCSDYSKSVIAYLRGHPELKTVVLVARWSYYAAGTGYGRERPENFRLLSRTGAPISFETALAQTVAAITATGASVIIFSQIPEIGSLVPARVATTLLQQGINDWGPTLNDFKARSGRSLDAIRSLAAPNVSVVHPYLRLCRTGTCQVEQDGRPLYRDDDHPSEDGSVLLAELLRGSSLWLSGRAPKMSVMR